MGLVVLGSIAVAVGACATAPLGPPELDTEDDGTVKPPRSSPEEGPSASASGTTTLPPAASGSEAPPASTATSPPPPPAGSPRPGPDASTPPSGSGCAGAKGVTQGPIDVKYKALGACTSVLGVATSNEMVTSDGAGRYNTFERGVIVWKSGLGAWEIHGLIHDRWAALGREKSVVGYPITDERGTPDGIGRYNVFQTGSIYWSPSTGAHEVLGKIRDKYKELGWEAGALGYPTSGEYAVSGGRRSDFQHGKLTWNASTGVVTVTMTP